MATDACNAGKVKLNGQNVKPSKEIRVGEVYHVRIWQLEKCVQVVDTPKSRVGAPLVSNYYTDLTSAEEYERVKGLNVKFEYREHGEGRPTKRDRRQIEYLKNHYAEDSGKQETAYLFRIP
jgi:ribosome-associated heat shock protein Hsp15